jgi:iron(III) transport system ATP-binding protein
VSALDVLGLRVSFGDHQVLQGVDLRVEDGVTAVLGSSGCGKSTLLRTIAGFIEPSGGEVRLGGRTVTGGGARSVPPRHRSIGYVPQEGALFPHLDVAANIAFGLSRAVRAQRSGRRGRQAHDRVAAMLDLVELPHHLATRQPHELSGGQQQRVAVARALAPGPDLVLLDEPFSSLDAGLREETGRAVVRALRAAGAAALLVTHDQGEALSLADQVAVMAQGRFLQVDTPLGVYLEPADAAVATFLGHAAVVPGTTNGGGTASCLVGPLPLKGEHPAGPVLLAIRPEQVEVTRAEQPGGARDGETDGQTPPAGVLATVIDASFFGHDATVRVQVDGHPEILTARTPADSVPQTGDRVLVQVTGEVLGFPGQVAP